MAEEHHRHHLFHHKKEDEGAPVEAGVYSETAYATEVVQEPPREDYEKEEKQHKHREHAGELGAMAAGAYALVKSPPARLLHGTIHPLDCEP